MGFFDDVPAAVPEPLWRHHHPWDPPEAEFPGIVPIGTTLLGRSDQAAVAITGLAAFSNGFEIQLTARSRPDGGDEAGPGLGRARHSFRFGLQLPDGRKVFGRHGPGRPAARTPSRRGRCCRRLRAAAHRSRSCPGGGPGRCRPRARWSSWPNGPIWACPSPGSAWTPG